MNNLLEGLLSIDKHIGRKSAQGKCLLIVFFVKKVIRRHSDHLYILFFISNLYLSPASSSALMFRNIFTSKNKVVYPEMLELP